MEFRGNCMYFQYLLCKIPGEIPREFFIKPTPYPGIQGSNFLEWSLSSPWFLTDKAKFEECISPNPSTFQVPGVEYIFEPAVGLDPETKIITLRSGKTVGPYGAVVYY
jgi:hypothetical protein